MRALNLTRWPWLAVLALAGGSAVGLAFLSVNLFARAMANVDFIQRHGWVAVEEGALIQMAGLLGWGLAALFAYLVFKACEVELVFRYFQWARDLDAGMEGRRQMRFRRKDAE